ncbi:uncharacterized protein LOC134210252 [Armigeres subalbatus]|uniref:uncharacterized protein LOC134210252 n=1 Tax=Armigeres subalbatus TaxID=124917 RepID=UPI002ED19940
MVYNTSLEAFQSIVLLARQMAGFCGVDLLADNYKPNLRTALTFIGCTSYIFTSMYSAWYYFPDVYKMLQALAPVGMAFQGCIKLCVALVHRKFFQGSAKFLEDFHQRHATRPEDNAVLLGLMKKLHLASRMLLCAYVLAILGFGLYPVYVYVMYGERTFAINVLLPGIDPDTHWGYVLTVAYQMFLLAIAMAGISAFDTTFMIFVSNLAGLVDVYTNKLKELDRLLEKRKTKPAEVRTLVREILIAHYGIVRRDYNDEVILAINGTMWYMLDKSQLKMIQFMLHRCQNPSNLTVGGFAPLNIETFVEIMKTIYQFFAMMINFVE